jgi:AraC-like DNA-binding protein
MNLARSPQSPNSTAATQLVPRQRLSTVSVPEDQRLAYWLDLICTLYVQLDCVPPQNQRIFGDVEFSRLGNVDFTHLRSNATYIRRTPERIRQSAEDCYLVLILREGRGAVSQDGRMAVVNPGDFVLNDCSRPYDLMFDAGGHDVYVLRVARKLLASHVSNAEDLCATTVTGQGAAGHLLLTMVESLGRDIADLHPTSAMGVSEAIHSVIGAGLRSLPDANRRKPSRLAAYHIARIKAHVQQHLRDPELSIGSVAHAMDLSADHLSRLFRDEPVALSRLIWQQRLEACQRDLTNPCLAERSISEIAFSWGFNDAAHFSRSFREQHGTSPREWRAAQLATPPRI